MAVYSDKKMLFFDLVGSYAAACWRVDLFSHGGSGCEGDWMKVGITKGQEMENSLKKELQEKIIALIVELLEVPEGTITPETRIEDVEEWDSLKHVEIIGELEERLGVCIPLDDAIELTSMPELFEKAGCL